MDRANHKPESLTPAANRPAASAGAQVRPSLRVISTGLRLAEPVVPADAAWADAFARLLGWLEIDVEAVELPRATGLRKVAGWAGVAGGGAAAPQFAPWQPISPVALQNPNSNELPRADWTASYLFDHGQGSAVRGAPIDLALMSPHPARCEADEAGDPAVPRPAILEAMIRAARDEGRERIVIIAAARQRNALARQLLLIDRGLTREGLELEILAVEQALPALMVPRPRWDALIVMPELRSIVFTLLAEASEVRAPWPMLWHDARGPVLVASEALGEAGARLSLDAMALVQALALTLQHAGMNSAARRLHECSARLRDSGTVTASRGSPAPYVTQVDDAQFVQLVCAGLPAGGRAVPQWRALGDVVSGGTGREDMRLYIVASGSSSSSS